MSHKPSKLGIKDLLHTQIISFTLNVGFCLRASGFKRNWKSFQHGKMLPGCCSCTINDLATDTPSSLSIQDWDLADERKSWTAFPSSLLRLWGGYDATPAEMWIILHDSTNSWKFPVSSLHVWCEELEKHQGSLWTAEKNTAAAQQITRSRSTSGTDVNISQLITTTVIKLLQKHNCTYTITQSHRNKTE